MNKIVFVYITNPSLGVAKKIARSLLEKKLIACGNIVESNSLYPWKGKLVSAREWILIAKTVKAKYLAVKKEVGKIHPYKIPCITMIPVQANDGYARWLRSCL